MRFRLVGNYLEMTEPGGYLVADNWDDWFEYEITYWLYIKEDSNSAPKCVERVKIAKRNQVERCTKIPKCFEELGEDYVSVGFQEEYYEELNKGTHREEILSALRDMAFDLNIYEQVKDDNVTRIALMREYTEMRLKRQIHRMAEGGARLTNYSFTYILHSVNPNTNKRDTMYFEVVPEKKPAQNIHVLVGKNGVGKTTIIKKMIFALEKENKDGVGEVVNADFANIVYISFSAFDDPIFEDGLAKPLKIPYKFVGLINSNKTVKNTRRLTEEFVDSSFGFYYEASKMRLWKETMRILESDSLFLEKEIAAWVSEEKRYQWSNNGKNKMPKEVLKEKHKEEVFDKFLKLSSGHKIILLTLANLIDLVE